jgi:hypothetical protein
MQDPGPQTRACAISVTFQFDHSFGQVPWVRFRLGPFFLVFILGAVAYCESRSRSRDLTR